MTETAVELARAFLVNPSVGIPAVLMTGALAAWIAWSPRNPRISSWIRRTWRPPVTDPVSRTYYALARERYVDLLTVVEERVNRSFQHRYGIPIREIPYFEFRRERLEIQDGGPFRRLADDLVSAFVEASSRADPRRIQWAFWRSSEADHAMFLDRLARLIARSDELLKRLEAAP